VAIVEPELADLEGVYASLDIPGHRIELLDGQVTVSPTASRPHSRIVQRLQVALWGSIQEHGWELHANLTLHVAATRERLVPDLWICPPAAPQFDENEVYGHGALLVAEVDIHYAYTLLVGSQGSAALALHVADHEAAVATLARQGFIIFTENDLRE